MSEVRQSAISINGLAQRMIAYDEHAYVEFADHFAPQLKGLFIGRGLTRGDAEDLAASCVTDIALKVRQYKPQESAQFSDWVFTIARHELANWWRAKKQKPISTEYLDDQKTSQHTTKAMLPDETSERQTEVAEAVDEALARLSEQNRDILLLHTGYGYAHVEIAEMLHISAGLVRMRHLRSLKRLKAILAADPRIQRHLRRDNMLVETVK